MKERDLTEETIRLCPGVRALPIVHGSVEFTVILRDLFMNSPPAMLALELPESMGPTLMRALPHADEIPVISITQEERELHFVMEPLEPLVEAARSAFELGLPIHLVDSYYELFPAWMPEYFPDTYALHVLDVPQLFDIYRGRRERENISEEMRILVDRIDHLREINMASHLRNLARLTSGSERIGENVLLVCGIKHVEGIRELLNMSEEEFNERRALLRTQAPPESEDAEPLEALLNQMEEKTDADDGPVYDISVLSRESPEVLEQPGYFNAAWNLTRKHDRAVPGFNRIALQRSAYRDAVDRYERESTELVPPQREKLFFQFTRNWSVVEGRLLPDAYRMVIAARGFGNDNFARFMYDTLFYLPPLHGSAFPERKITLDDLHRDSRLIRFRLKMKMKRKVPPPRILRRFKREKYPGEWREAWRDGGICSYPPEDIQVEDFGRYMQQRARTILQGAETKSVPFSSSLLDGIDYRETIRNLHLGKIFVRDANLRGLEAGSVVVIFSEDEEVHDWKVVWWGEHDQESDMAFYATQPGPNMVGPGITRCIYGGFMLTYPPGRLHDIWSDDFYAEFDNPADRLLAAGLEYNERNAVVHLSNRAPNPRIQTIAGRMGQKIIHIPLSTISSVMLGRVRRFHVLDSRERREDADDFIW